MKHQLTLALLLVTSIVLAQTQIKDFNLKKQVALDGYDPVSYFDNKPEEGKAEIKATHNGAIYYFINQQNVSKFKANPSKYEPAYGGWCAYAMGDSGKKVEVDPETFKIVDNKLYLFYNKFFNNTLTSWNKDETNLKNNADKNWQRILK